jgi:transcriptional regulator with XRE-family HTH domain
MAYCLFPIIYDPMKIERLTPASAMLSELGQRLANLRTQRGFSQEQLATEAGIGVATLRRIEDGKDARLGSWLRLLKVLELEGAIDQLLPENYRSPMAEVREVRRGRRANGRGGPAAGTEFAWGDEQV